MLQKAKANNKYFAAMQSKETIEQDCRNSQRTVEKQLLLLQKAQEVEKSLNAQVVRRLVHVDGRWLMSGCA